MLMNHLLPDLKPFNPQSIDGKNLLFHSFNLQLANDAIYVVMNHPYLSFSLFFEILKDRWICRVILPIIN